MKNGLLAAVVVLFIAVGVLFYLQFSTRTAGSRTATPTTASNAAKADGSFRIAYFEMDSVENSYALVKDVKNELTREEEKINAERNRLTKMFRDKYARYQNQQMTQVQSEAATRDLQQTQKQMDEAMMNLEQRYQDMKVQRMTEIKNRIETFLKQYNSDNRFAFIFANEPGLFYYRDTALNITDDVVKGLNSNYQSKEKK